MTKLTDLSNTTKLETMNKISTTSVPLVDGYRAYLAKKSGTSMSAGTFAKVSQRFQTASSAGATGCSSTLVLDGEGKNV